MATLNKTLEAVYGYLQPKAATTDVKAEDYLEVIMGLILGPPGTFKSFKQIKQSLEDRFKSEQDGTGQIFHAIHSTAPFTTTERLKMGGGKDDEYWNVDGTPINLFGGLIDPTTFSKTPTAAASAISVFVTRGPYINPSHANTNNIEFFLNYIPSYVANMLIPYLEVEFELPKYGTANKEEINFYTNTPSTLRFLLGSGPLTSPSTLKLTDADIALEDATILGSGPDGNQKPYSAFSGMDMFLSPQTLTNMDSLKASSSTKENEITRIVDVKPFVPFMSIESLTMNHINAGSGAMVHRKASLKIAIHDKARLPEIAEFIRGPSGYSDATIWLTYGWIMPRSYEKEDAYAEFINKNFLAKNGWQVMNSQYQFDAAGKVSLSLDMVSKGVASLQTININLTSQMKELGALNEIISRLQQIVEKITAADSAAGVEIRIPQVLSAGLGGETSVKNAAVEIAALKKALEKSGKLSAEDLSQLEKDLTKLQVEGADAEGKKFTTFEKAINDEISTAILNIIKVCENKKDPFLPADANKKYFINYERIKKAIQLFYTPPPITPKPGETTPTEPTAPEKDVLSIEPFTKVTTFGKLFMNAILPGIVEANVTNEVQVIFYALNDSCGPVSGCSIAEFPIDTKRLSYTYYNYVRSRKSFKMTIEEFMSLIVQSQFNTYSAIGYGASHLYEYHPEGGEEKANDKIDGYADLLAEWQYSDPPFRTRPSIEMKLEYGQVGPSGGVIYEINQSMKDIKEANRRIPSNESFKDDPNEMGKTILRIHIYDKQNKPHKNLQRIINTDSGFVDVGNFSDNATEKKLSAWWSTLDPEKRRNLVGGTTEDFLKAYKDATKEDLAVDVLPTGIKKPGIGKDRKSIISAISRFVPTITIGTEGTLINQAQIQTKTDNLAAAANLVNQSKKLKEGANPAGPASAVQGPDGIPIRTFPGQMTMTTFGCTPADLYQQYFIDFGTGTSLDNLYNCSQINHTVSPGKFETQWTFIFTDGYGTLAGSPTAALVAKGIASKFISSAKEEMQKTEMPPVAAATTAAKK